MFWEMVFWGLNVAICTESIMGVDMGGSVIIHAFGCFFGLAASYFFQPSRAADHPNIASNHNSEIVALECKRPTFQAALGHASSAAVNAPTPRLSCCTPLASPWSPGGVHGVCERFPRTLSGPIVAGHSRARRCNAPSSLQRVYYC